MDYTPLKDTYYTGFDQYHVPLTLTQLTLVWISLKVESKTKAMHKYLICSVTPVSKNKKQGMWTRRREKPYIVASILWGNWEYSGHTGKASISDFVLRSDTCWDSSQEKHLNFCTIFPLLPKLYLQVSHSYNYHINLLGFSEEPYKNHFSFLLSKEKVFLHPLHVLLLKDCFIEY